MTVSDIDLTDLFEFDVELGRTGVVVAAMVFLDVVWFALMGASVADPHAPMPGTTWLMKTAHVPMDAPGAMELAVAHLGTLHAIFDYLVMWGVMMWAMMYVTMTRFTREYAQAHTGSDRDAYSAVAGFLSGYNVTWALSGVVPLAFHYGLTLLGFRGIYGFVRTDPPLVLGGLFVLAGLFQFTELKQDRLRTCCAHVDPHEDGYRSALRTGLDHGVSCVVTCFGFFFLLMPFVGEMNYFVMAALTAPVVVERLPARWGHEMAKALGVTTLLLGLSLLVFQPALDVAFTTSMGA